MPDTKLKLLIVDDEAVTRMSLSNIFTRLGYEVRTAEDGFSALAVIRLAKRLDSEWIRRSG